MYNVILYDEKYNTNYPLFVLSLAQLGFRLGSKNNRATIITRQYDYNIYNKVIHYYTATHICIVGLLWTRYAS